MTVADDQEFGARLVHLLDFTQEAAKHTECNFFSSVRLGTANLRWVGRLARESWQAAFDRHVPAHEANDCVKKDFAPAACDPLVVSGCVPKLGIENVGDLFSHIFCMCHVSLQLWPLGLDGGPEEEECFGPLGELVLWLMETEDALDVSGRCIFDFTGSDVLRVDQSGFPIWDEDWELFDHDRAVGPVNPIKGCGVRHFCVEDTIPDLFPVLLYGLRLIAGYVDQATFRFP